MQQFNRISWAMPLRPLIECSLAKICKKPVSHSSSSSAIQSMSAQLHSWIGVRVVGKYAAAKRCEGEVKSKETELGWVWLRGTRSSHLTNISEGSVIQIRSSLTIFSGGGLLPTRHSSLPLECLTACCVASAVMIGGPGARKYKRPESREIIFFKYILKYWPIRVRLNVMSGAILYRDME